MIVRRTRPGVGGLLVIIGGQSRKVGKSALVVDLIRAFPERRWTAVKITPYAEEGCPVKGARCGCAPNQHVQTIREESDRTGRSDTSRFLAAGAKRALWMRTKAGHLGEAMPSLAKALEDAEDVIIESDAVTRFWRPDLFLMVLDPRKADFKRSARAGAQLADAFVLRSPEFGGNRAQIAAVDAKPRFLHPMGYDLPANMQTFVRQHFRRAGHLTDGHGRVFLVDPDCKREDNVSLRV